ncbi:MAG: hypothetical protein CMF50_01710 [Legionellales bacterium]|nr:hypothetical protein [Legionellales bacterium]
MPRTVKQIAEQALTTLSQFSQTELRDEPRQLQAYQFVQNQILNLYENDENSYFTSPEDSLRRVIKAIYHGYEDSGAADYDVDEKFIYLKPLQTLLSISDPDLQEYMDKLAMRRIHSVGDSYNPEFYDYDQEALMLEALQALVAQKVTSEFGFDLYDVSRQMRETKDNVLQAIDNVAEQFSSNKLFKHLR